MQSRRLLSRLRREIDTATARRVFTVLVVLAVAVPMLGGHVAAQEEDSYSVEQGDECVEITPIDGNESVLEFYEYGGPGNYSAPNSTNNTYRSEGTVDIQEANTSTLFLYEDPNGTLSLVFLNGANDTSSVGGAVTVNITGLPDDGEWTVKDDQYDGPRNYDNWTHEERYDRINWTWDDKRTDGGAYSGLGDDFSVTIEPAFNEDAELYDEHYNGTVENWTATSGPRDDLERTSLDLSEPVTVSAGDCEASEEAEQ
jgi:hypothetical protein